MLWGAAPATAHTSLVDSTPANRSTLAEGPQTLRLVFSNPVDPRLVSVDVLDAGGGEHPGARRVTPDQPDATIVEFRLPSLPPATYGVRWQSLGRDGHRVAGEIVLGVGAGQGEGVASAHFTTVTTADRALDALVAAGRFVWYLGLALAAGALYSLRWLHRHGARYGPADAPFAAVARRLLGVGLRTALAGVVLRVVGVVAVVSTTIGFSVGGVGDALASTNGTLGIFAALLVAAALGFASPLAGAERRVVPVAGALGLAAFTLAIGGHALTQPAPVLGVLVAAAHVAAAALWLGPLTTVSFLSLSRGWRATDRPARGALLQRFFGDYAKVAAWTFAVLALTGARAAWVLVRTRFLDSSYGVALVVKLALIVAVVGPLGVYHDRVVRVRRARERKAQEKRARAALTRPAFLRTIRVESVAILAVLGVAAVLSGLNPATQPGGTGVVAAGGGAAREFATGLSAQPVATRGGGGGASECARLNVGKANCYRDYFSRIMRAQGAGVAVAKVQELSATDDYVRTDCHQITHDLGQDAAIYYRDLGRALSFNASACWSGYYHGVVEYTLSKFGDDRLRSELPGVCASVASSRYAFSHYNCVHGVGHGIMIRFQADLFRAIPYCEAYTDAWELSSCVGGVFMENVVEAQEGHRKATFRESDLLYPCNAVGEGYKDECFAMQTSYVLWKIGYDWRRAFEVCDRAETAYVDDCYQSMGRDISGSVLLDPKKVVARCDLGRAEFREFCVVGASLNAVFNDHGTANATRLCEMVAKLYRSACIGARDRAASQL